MVRAVAVTGCNPAAERAVCSMEGLGSAAEAMVRVCLE